MPDYNIDGDPYEYTHVDTTTSPAPSWFKFLMVFTVGALSCAFVAVFSYWLGKGEFSLWLAIVLECFIMSCYAGWVSILR